jgi:N-succinyldiaminopimelate aminotransferase
MIRRTRKWDHIGTSIFSVMTQKAQAAQAINLAQGFPDFDGPDAIKEAAIGAIRSGHNQYAPAFGIAPLRASLARHQAKRTGVSYDPDQEVTVFSGATEAIYCALQAILEAGDEIIALEPFYDSYPAAAYAAGARLVGVPLTSDWRLEPESLERAVSHRTRAMIINTPHNPSGKVLNQAEMDAIRDVAIRHNLIVIMDEVYEELVYAPSRHISMAALADMRERTITISSTSKTFSFTGWKVGYAFASPELTRMLRAVHQFTVFCSATPLQHGMVAAFDLAEDYFEELRADYQKKRDLLVSALKDSGFRCTTPAGTYFAIADYRGISDLDDVAFCDWLIQKVKVAAVPLSAFYSDQSRASREVGHVRFAFCKGMNTLEEAASRLKKGCR